VFTSFYLAGFEGTTGFNKHRQWIDQVSATQHDICLRDDYRRLKELAIHAARETIRWPLVDRRGGYDFSSVSPIIQASRDFEIDVLYDLFHFGYPADLDLFSANFAERFSEYCYAVTRFISRNSDGQCFFAPLNEPSYFSWAAGEVGLFAPHATGRGFELKVRLIEAGIRAIEAVWSACPSARIINIDPLCRVVAPVGDDDAIEHVNNFNSNAVFQAWDMLCGRLMPELGGSPRHLDTIGVNYYWTNQWEWGKPERPLDDADKRLWRIGSLLQQVHQRYGADILITETSHIGERRAPWLLELAVEAEAMLSRSFPLGGICIYPILGLQDWHVPEFWPPMGLWDLVNDGYGRLERVPYEPMMNALRQAQRLEQGHFERLNRVLQT